MSGAADSETGLREALSVLPPVKADDSAARALLADARALALAVPDTAAAAIRANSLEAGMAGTLTTFLAAEAAADAYKAAAREIKALQAECEAVAAASRHALARAMAETGAPRVDGPTHSATPTEPARRLIIEDEAALPFGMTEIKTVANTAAIRAALDAGQDVPGARYESGEPGVRINPKRSAKQ